MSDQITIETITASYLHLATDSHPTHHFYLFVDYENRELSFMGVHPACDNVQLGREYERKAARFRVPNLTMEAANGLLHNLKSKLVPLMDLWCEGPSGRGEFSSKGEQDDDTIDSTISLLEALDERDANSDEWMTCEQAVYITPGEWLSESDCYGDPSDIVTTAGDEGFLLLFEEVEEWIEETRKEVEVES